MLTRKQRATLQAAPAHPNRVAAAMRLAGVTQVDVAQGTKLTQSWVSKIKNGQYSDLPEETRTAFAAYFKCEASVLFPQIEAEPPAADRRDTERRAGERRSGDRRRPYERRMEAR